MWTVVVSCGNHYAAKRSAILTTGRLSSVVVVCRQKMWRKVCVMPPSARLARGTWESHGWQWPSALRMTRTRLTGCARPHPRVLELASGAGSTILAAGGRGPLPPPQRLKSVVWVVASPRAVPAPCCGEASQQRTLWALWVRRRLCLGRLTDRGSGLQGTCKAKRTSIETKSSWGGARTCGHQPVSMRVSAARRPRRLSGAS